MAAWAVHAPPRRPAQPTHAPTCTPPLRCIVGPGWARVIMAWPSPWEGPRSHPQPLGGNAVTHMGEWWTGRTQLLLQHDMATAVHLWPCLHACMHRVGGGVGEAREDGDTPHLKALIIVLLEVLVPVVGHAAAWSGRGGRAGRGSALLYSMGMGGRGPSSTLPFFMIMCPQ